MGLLPVAAAGVTLASAQVPGLHVAASDPLALTVERLQTTLGDGPGLTSMTTGTAVLVPDLSNDDRYRAWGPMATGSAAVFAFPLRHGDRRLGALTLYCDAPGLIDQPTQDAAQTLADVAAALLLQAGTAMHQAKHQAEAAPPAKRQGGVTLQVIDLPQAEEALDRRNLERDLHEALARAEIEVAYQPIVRAVDGWVTGVEALVRWTHPGRGPVGASTAVALAESTGLITEIGTWVLERSCRDWAAWLAERPDRPLDLSVNVSARQLMAPGFDAIVATVLHETGMDPAALVLEVTEGIFVADGDRAMSVLGDLQRIGTRLALDDFGTGYSSLSYLRRFPVDIVKIEEQRDEVVRIGCERAQGYYFARPMSASELSARFN